MSDATFSVYKHTSPDGKVYIGITKSEPEHRFNKGRGYKQNDLFYSDICKFGWENFKHEIIASGLSVDEACTLEIELIREYDSINPNKCYNLQNGGQYISAEKRAERKIKEESRKNLKALYGHLARQERIAQDELRELGTLIQETRNSLDGMPTEMLNADKINGMLYLIVLRAISFSDRHEKIEREYHLNGGDADAES
jgi:hypothetical protein